MNETQDVGTRLVQAFVQGVAWWEYETTTTPLSLFDMTDALREAERRLGDQTLGSPLANEEVEG